MTAKSTRRVKSVDEEQKKIASYLQNYEAIWNTKSDSYNNRDIKG